MLARGRDIATAPAWSSAWFSAGPSVARILQLTGLDEVLPPYRDVPHSLAMPVRPGPAGR